MKNTGNAIAINDPIGDPIVIRFVAMAFSFLGNQVELTLAAVPKSKANPTPDITWLAIKIQ